MIAASIRNENIIEAGLIMAPPFTLSLQVAIVFIEVFRILINI